jgi:anti-sigma regulatory factor (Ser/Thr protein kinase)
VTLAGTPEPVRLRLPARPESVGVARHAASAYAESVGADPEAVAVAVSETVTNAVVHAYRDMATPGRIRVRADTPPDDGLEITVEDSGGGMHPRSDSPGSGLGLALVAQLAQTFEVGVPPGGGTRVCMSFPF